MKIVIDRNIPGTEVTFARHGELVLAEGRSLARRDLADADALIVRSVTPVNAALLAGTRVRFVGSATIGTDHLDTAWLERAGIRWASAPGCNATGTAEYSLAMTVLACQRLGLRLDSLAVGIVGHGAVGRHLHRLLEAAGVRQVLLNDPPLADQGQPGYSSMGELEHCDVISLHVPLTRTGRHPTLGLVDRSWLSRLRPGALLVNTSRGRVIQGEALAGWLSGGRGSAALDVWPDEPHIDDSLLAAAAVATPHVAGYGIDGKLRGTAMVYREFCQWLQSDAEVPDLLAGLSAQTLPPAACASVETAILAACPVARDDHSLRAVADLDAAQRAAAFDALRERYPDRRDFRGWALAAGTRPELASKLRNLGFH